METQDGKVKHMSRRTAEVIGEVRDILLQKGRRKNKGHRLVRRFLDP
jgi:hypothetical protein